jgi:hypothetical protein
MLWVVRVAFFVVSRLVGIGAAGPKESRLPAAGVRAACLDLIMVVLPSFSSFSK